MTKRNIKETNRLGKYRSKMIFQKKVDNILKYQEIPIWQAKNEAVISSRVFCEVKETQGESAVFKVGLKRKRF